MKHLITIFFLFFTGHLFSQDWERLEKEWYSIEINQREREGLKRSYHYTIERSTLGLSPRTCQDSTLKQIDQQLINDLFDALRNPIDIENELFNAIGRDSLWLMKNAERLWENYPGNPTGEENDELAVEIIRNYSETKVIAGNTIAWSYIAGLKNNRPIDIMITTPTGYFFCSAGSRTPYLLPWWSDLKENYNPKIAITLNQILPIPLWNDSIMNEYQRIFEYELIDRLYSFHIKDTIDKINMAEAEKIYGIDFRYLKRFFTVYEAKISKLNSIDWGYGDGTSCLQAKFSDYRAPNHVFYLGIFGKKNILNQKEIGISRKSSGKILKQLNQNRVLNYCDSTKTSCEGLIHFVNNRSLSWKARQKFLTDVQSSNQSNHIYKRKFRKAILFEMTESRNGEESKSTWIFLKNGTIILWKLEGTFLMNYTKETLQNGQFFCKRMYDLEQ